MYSFFPCPISHLMFSLLTEVGSCDLNCNLPPISTATLPLYSSQASQRLRQARRGLTEPGAAMPSSASRKPSTRPYSRNTTHHQNTSPHCAANFQAKQTQWCRGQGGVFRLAGLSEPEAKGARRGGRARRCGVRRAGAEPVTRRKTPPWPRRHVLIDLFEHSSHQLGGDRGGLSSGPGPTF